METNSLILILVVLLVVAAALFLLTRRRVGAAPPDAVDLPPAELSTSAAEALIDPVTAIPPEAVAPPIGLAGDALAPPFAEEAPAPLRQAPAPAGPPDDLTQLKGLGPKAATQLNALGIVRFDQLAALSGAELAAVDAQMGPLQGRIARDRWVEQAGHLATGDVAGFEAKFGKLGG